MVVALMEGSQLKVIYWFFLIIGNCFHNIFFFSIIFIIELCVACNSKYSGYQHELENHYLQKYANAQIQKSYDYLMLATNFGSYVKNRPGLEKLFKSMADKAWDDGVSVIEHINRRGGEMFFDQNYNDTTFAQRSERSMLKDEIYALSYSLDIEKEMAAKAHQIHQSFSHVKDKHHYDPEIAHYMEEKFIENDAEVIYKLSGYTNELAKLISTKGSSIGNSLGMYLFDEYLQSQ